MTSYQSVLWSWNTWLVVRTLKRRRGSVTKFLVCRACVETTSYRPMRWENFIVGTSLRHCHDATAKRFTLHWSKFSRNDVKISRWKNLVHQRYIASTWFQQICDVAATWQFYVALRRHFDVASQRIFEWILRNMRRRAFTSFRRHPATLYGCNISKCDQSATSLRRYCDYISTS